MLENLGKQTQIDADISVDEQHETEIKLIGLEQDGNLVFPYTHSSALLGPISDFVANIDNEVYKSDWNNAITSGLYYSNSISSTSNWIEYMDYTRNSYYGLVIVYRADTYIVQISEPIDLERTDVDNYESLLPGSASYIRYANMSGSYIRRGNILSDGSINWYEWQPFGKEPFRTANIVVRQSSLSSDPVIPSDTHNADASRLQELLTNLYRTVSLSGVSITSSFIVNANINCTLQLDTSIITGDSSRTYEYFNTFGKLYFNTLSDADKPLFTGICTGTYDDTTYAYKIDMYWPRATNQSSSLRFTFKATKIEEDEPIKALPEIATSDTEPTDDNITVWIDTSEESTPSASQTTSRYILVLDNDVEASGTVTVPSSYIVGDDSLEVHYLGEKLIKSTDTIEGHYKEVGTNGSASSAIQLTDDWSASAGDYFDFIIISA